jgi:hypothetical protein
MPYRVRSVAAYLLKALTRLALNLCFAIKEGTTPSVRLGAPNK